MTWKPKLLSDAFPFDLTNSDNAYLFGLIQTDGNITSTTRNRGRVSIELAFRDKSILEKIQPILPCRSSLTERVRESNFSKSFRSAILSIHDKRFRDALLLLGLAAGKKSDTIAPPEIDLLPIDYWRGVIDGDGSLGFTGDGRPFLGLVSASEPLNRGFERLVFQLTGAVRNTNRNKRDKVFNTVIFDEYAQTLAAYLYSRSTLAIQRKYDAASAMQLWTRPPNRPRRVSPVRRWTTDQDVVVLNSSLEDAAFALGRTRQSVAMRKWRLDNRQRTGR